LTQPNPQSRILLRAERCYSGGMTVKSKKLFSGNRYGLLLTLGLAVLLPALALIFVNYQQLKSIKRDKKVEALIHRDFQQFLAVSEKKINQKAYSLIENVRPGFPTEQSTEEERTKQLDSILAQNPWLAHVFLFDRDKPFIFRSQPNRMNEKYFRDEHDLLSEIYHGWLSLESKTMAESMGKKTRPISCYTSPTKRPTGETYATTAFFTLPNCSSDKLLVAGAIIEPEYLQKTFFPELLDELITQKVNDDQDQQLAMLVYPLDSEGGRQDKPLATSEGWSSGKAEVSRNLDDVFRGLALGIKFRGTTAEAISRRLVTQSFLILGVLSMLMIGGLVLTYRNVNKEIALARMKSDFVSNVSHELRTPLALIRLYAETLELGRIKTMEKKQEYYCIIRKESERLTALINNILDFSRIEAGRKEYDFRETDIAELVRNTLDAYRYQIEQQGFDFRQQIDADIPAVHIDREAIARALLNLVNNALKYSADDKYLAVKLYRANGILKLEVADHGIGITSREQSKIFEKFYRTGDALVHNTRGSGLGLSLVRHITHAHGGEVEVESTPGKGSKFTLSLPLNTGAHRQSNGKALGGAAS
jgi:signal transduction histidine kinase